METTNNDKPTNTNYALNGKIMLCSVIILFIVVFAVACFHSYLNGCFHRHPRRRRRNRARHLLSRRVSLANAIIETVSVSPTPKALGPSILKTLPTFVYSPTAHSPVVVLECAVCLSDFEDEDQGRVLPNCNHTFHEDCIDTWFQSHSNCPLCRAPVQPDMPEIPSEIAIIMSEPPGSEHQRAEAEMGCSRCSPSTSFSPEEGGRRLLELEGISVDDARDDERLKRGLGSPKNDGLKSSGNQILSLKRIWSI